MAKTHTPTITEITKKLKRAGFRKVHREALLTQRKSTYADHARPQGSFPTEQFIAKEPTVSYGKPKKRKR